MSGARAGSADFHAARAEIGELHDKKQRDYGADGDPFANIRQTEEWGVPASMGACMRIGDKVSRLKTFYRTGELANESVEDAYLDLAVYALIGLCLFREEQAAKDANAKAAESSSTCVLCHAFMFNHGPNGECPVSALVGGPLTTCIRCNGTGGSTATGSAPRCLTCNGTGRVPA